MSPSFASSCSWFTTHCYHTTINFTISLAGAIRAFLDKTTRILLSFIHKAGIGPASLAVFLAIIAHQIQDHAASPSVKGISEVSGLYGPGDYYGWLINDIVAVYESIHSKSAESMFMFVDTVGVAIQPSMAAIGQLRCVARPELCVQAQLDAFDRVGMVSWIVTMHYLLQKMVNWTKNRQEPRRSRSSPAQVCSWRPSPQSVVRITLGVLNTTAMVAYDVQRGTLVKRLLLCLGPCVACIVIPLIVVYYLQRLQCATAVINAGTILISIAYVFTPYEYRYDPHSPTAPVSAYKLSDDDQLAALGIGFLILLRHIWKYFGRIRVMGKSTLNHGRALYRRLMRLTRGRGLHTLEEGMRLTTTDTGYHHWHEEL